MKKLPFLALLAALGACSSSEPAPEREPQPGAPASAPAPEANAALRAELNAKRADLNQVNADLDKINQERKQLAEQEASQAKTNRLIELSRAESDTKVKRDALAADVSALEKQLGVAAPAARPAPAPKADDSLDSILAVAEDKKKEDAQRAKRKMDEETAAEKSRLAQADEARRQEEAARAKEKVQSAGPAPSGPDAPGFEDRFAQAIIKIREELQRFKRW